MATGDLVALADLVTFMGPVPGAQQTTQLSVIISQVSARIHEFCGRYFPQGNYTEYKSGRNQLELVLRNRPVKAAGLSVFMDNTTGGFWGQAPNSFDSTTQLTIGVDFGLRIDMPDGVTSRSGILFRINDVWRQWATYRGGRISPLQEGEGNGNIKVVYTGGFASIPLDIQEGCMMLCAAVQSRAGTGEQYEQESRETYSYNYRPIIGKMFSELPPDVRAIFSRYRNVAIG